MVEGLVWLVALILMGLVACFTFGEGEPRKARFWAAAASKLGGSYRPVTDEIRFIMLDRPARLAEEPAPEGEGVATVLELDLGLDDGHFRIKPAGLISRLARMLGTPYLAVGDPDFDSRFVMESNPESLALQVFNADRKADTLRALREASFTSVDVSPEGLRLTLDHALSTEKEILALARAARVLAVGILGRDPAVLILDPMEFRPPCGHCLVCRSPLREGVVYCRRCRTPHHEECWGLVRKCSTYGCNEDRYITLHAAGR